MAQPQQQVCCKCGIPAKICTVKKNGPNFGKMFYGCSKGQYDQTNCHFFLPACQDWQQAEKRPDPPQQLAPYAVNTPQLKRSESVSSDVLAESLKIIAQQASLMKPMPTPIVPDTDLQKRLAETTKELTNIGWQVDQILGIVQQLNADVARLLLLQKNEADKTT